uniref:Uncharacterized protein n=1 Tax=Photinus pyralis TaxID=7054 RepID=A0A1Y1NAZ0_PHOPY
MPEKKRAMQRLYTSFENTATTVNISSGRISPMTHFFRPKRLDRYPMGSAAASTPSPSIDPTHDDSSLVRWKEVAFDSSCGSTGDVQLIDTPNVTGPRQNVANNIFNFPIKGIALLFTVWVILRVLPALE